MAAELVGEQQRVIHGAIDRGVEIGHQHVGHQSVQTGGVRAVLNFDCASGRLEQHWQLLLQFDGIQHGRYTCEHHRRVEHRPVSAITET